MTPSLLPEGTVEDLLKPENKDKLTADADLSRGARKGDVDRHLRQEMMAKTVEGEVKIDADLDNGRHGQWRDR
jgi:hypothetical protein